MRGFGFFLGFSRGGGAAGWIGYLLNALGFATSGEQTLTAPDPNLALDWEGTLTDFGGAVNASGDSVAPPPGSRLVTTVADGAVLGSELWDGVGTSLGSGWSGSGLTYIKDGTAAPSNVTDTILEIGANYQATITVTSTAGDVRIRIGSSGTTSSYLSNGTETIQGVALGSNSAQIQDVHSSFNGTVTISFKQILPTVLDTDTSSNPLHPSVTTGGVTDYVFYPARENDESVISEDYRTSGSGVGEYYYQQQEMGELWDQGVVTYTGSEGVYMDVANITISTSTNYTWTATVSGLTSGQARVFLGASAVVQTTSDGSFSGTGIPSSDSFSVRTGNAQPNAGATVAVTISVLPSTSLTSPLENSDGQWYEERVRNGGFDVDAEWVEVSGTWVISGGVITCSSSGYLQQIIQGNTETSKSYKLRYEITAATITAGLSLRGGSSSFGNVTLDGTVGEHTLIITAIDNNGYLIFYANTWLGDIDNVSVIEVDSDGNPTNILDGGTRDAYTNYLLNSGTPATQTTGSLGVGWYSLLTWDNTGSCAVTAGTATIANLTGAASDGTPAYFEVTAGGTVTITETGTVDYFQLTGGVVTHQQAPWIETTTGTVTQSINVDESVLWTYEGRYGISGQRVEFPASQYLLNSDSPATQTTGSLTTGTYTCWIEDGDTGSATVSAGTATITGGGAASDGSDLTFEVTGAGTVTVTVAGTVTFFQLEGGSFRTSHIVTVGSTITRSAVNLKTVVSDTNLGTDDGAARLVITPLGTSQVGKILASYTDASNELSVDLTATTITLNKTVAGSTDTATKTYTHADGEQIIIDFAYGSGGMSINSFVVGATAGSAGTNAATSAAVLGTNIQLGASNDAEHINATFDTAIRSYATEAQASADIADWSL